MISGAQPVPLHLSELGHKHAVMLFAHRFFRMFPQTPSPMIRAFHSESVRWLLLWLDLKEV